MAFILKILDTIIHTYIYWTCSCWFSCLKILKIFGQIHSRRKYHEWNTSNFETIQEENEHNFPLNAQWQHDILKQCQQQERELAAKWKWHQCEWEKLLEIDNGIQKEDGWLYPLFSTTWIWTSSWVTISHMRRYWIGSWISRPLGFLQACSRQYSFFYDFLSNLRPVFKPTMTLVLTLTNGPRTWRDKSVLNTTNRVRDVTFCYNYYYCHRV
jgi:hypothetical protein